MVSRVPEGALRPAKHHVQGVEFPVTVVPSGAGLHRRYSVGGLASASTAASVAGPVDYPASEPRRTGNCEDCAGLPILKSQYVARGVRVLSGSRWRLNRFQDRTIVLRTGAEPTLAVYAVDATTALFEVQPEAMYALELDTNCEFSGSAGSSLNGHTGIQLSSPAGAPASRLRIRFSTAADATIWCSVVRETLAHARWSRDIRAVKQHSYPRERNIRIVQNVHSSERFVVKVLTTDHDQGDCHELQILRSLYSSCSARAVGLLRGYRVVETPQELLLIMPQLPGITLLQLLRQRRRRGQKGLHNNDVRQLLHLIAKCLQTVHRSGIVHCDLNLENVLVVSDFSNAWLIDFGGAYDLLNSNNSTRQDQQMTGTPGYVAPERVQDPLAPPTPGADVFSLGVILFQTLTGQHPYLDGTRKKRSVQLSDSLHLDWNRGESFLVAKAVPPALRELVRKMLLADPQTRIPLQEVILAAS